MVQNAQKMNIPEELTETENTTEDVLKMTPLAKLSLLSNA